MYFKRINKAIPFTGLVKRRPTMVGYGRGWQPEVRGDFLGEIYLHKTILTMTYLYLIFVFGVM